MFRGGVACDVLAVVVEIMHPPIGKSLTRDIKGYRRRGYGGMRTGGKHPPGRLFIFAK